MEKKGNRCLPATRSTATDSKKDGVSSKQRPRGVRRRESAGGSLSSKAEPSRKPPPQRTKTLDKRPKPRGTLYAGPVARNEAPWLEEPQAELGSVFLPGSKKQSLNHLLNFCYAPREGYRSERTNREGRGNRVLCTKKHKYNKEHFLQANCQFIVNESGDYKPYLNDPDALVDWSLIEQVTVQVSEFPSCPICLYPPAAAKMTRCGHIYCWSCVLHYLSLSDKPSRKCPICFEPLRIGDLKSVVANRHSSFNVNEVITFKLMKRPIDGLVAYPDGHDVRADEAPLNLSETGVRDVYSKLLVANSDDVLSIIARERRELSVQSDEDGDSPERCFIEQAEALLKEREAAVLSSTTEAAPPTYSASAAAAAALDALSIADEDGDSPERKWSEAAASDALAIARSDEPKCHYFYQAADGQHVYLHALNARMLEHEYGALEHAPKTLTGRILEKEGGSMTQELRRRFRYLRHLPLTCHFEVAEIGLRGPVVGRDALDRFREQLEARARRRRRRAKDERRRERRIETEADERSGRYAAAVPEWRLESDDQFPEFSEGASASEGNAYVGPSFATMLAKEKSQTPTRPDPKPPKPIDAAGAETRAGRPPVRDPSDSDPEPPEGYEPAPSFNTSFGDAIAQALQQAEEGIQAKGKKKKRSKQKVLFTTNMAYSGN